MFSKLIKIALAALVLHGAWRVGSAYWTFYQFEDRLTQIAQFGDRRQDRDLCKEVADAVVLLQLPVVPEAVSLRRGGNPSFNCARGFEGMVAQTGLPAGKITFQASYVEQVTLLPGYRYPWPFNAQVEVWARAY